MMGFGVPRAWVLDEDGAAPIVKRVEAYGTSSRDAVVRRVAEVAGRRGVPPAQVALAWTLHKPGVSAALIGATKPSHVDDARTAAALTLTAEEIAVLEEPYVPYRGDGVPSEDRQL